MIYWLSDKDLNISSAILRVSGPDANTYLQGQLTQELRVAVGKDVYGLWLDLKGKVFGDSQVLKRAENDYLIVSFSNPAPDLAARLEAYVIADDVVVEDVGAQWETFLLWSDGEVLPTAPADAFAFPSRRAGPNARVWLVPAESAASARQALGQHAKADWAAAERSRLQAALPAVPVDIGSRDLPNEGALDEVAISYTKGCYLGQEVMARLKNLGQVRRRLHVVRGPGEPPAAGADVFQGGRRVGEFRSSVREGNAFLAMAMLSLVNLDAAAPLSRSAEAAADISLVRRV